MTQSNLVHASCSTNKLTPSPRSLASSLPTLPDPSSSNTSVQSASSFSPPNTSQQLVPFHPQNRSEDAITHEIIYPASHPLHNLPRHKHSDYFNALSDYTMSPRVSRVGQGSTNSPGYAIMSGAIPPGMLQDAQPITRRRSSKLVTERKQKFILKNWRLRDWRPKLCGLIKLSRTKRRQPSITYDQNASTHSIEASSQNAVSRAIHGPCQHAASTRHAFMQDSRQDLTPSDRSESPLSDRPGSSLSDHPGSPLEMRQVTRPLFTSMSTVSLRERQHWRHSLPSRTLSLDDEHRYYYQASSSERNQS